MLRIPDAAIIYQGKRLGGRKRRSTRTSRSWPPKRPSGVGLTATRRATARGTRKYAINRYVNWRKERGLDADPEAWVEQLDDGTRKAFNKHLMILLDEVRSDEFDGDKMNEKGRKHYFRKGAFTNPTSSLCQPTGSNSPRDYQPWPDSDDRHDVS